MSDPPPQTVRATAADLGAATRALCYLWASPVDRVLLAGRLETAVRRHLLALTRSGISLARARGATRDVIRQAIKEAAGARAVLAAAVMAEADHILAQLAAPLA